jgi:hypothetical protein
MNARSFESRLTIITTDVGSEIFTSCCAMDALLARATPITSASFEQSLAFNITFLQAMDRF